MHILWLKTELLHPVDKGGRIRTYQMLRVLRRHHRITYLTLDDGEATEEAVARSSEYCTDLVRVPFRLARRRSATFFAEIARSLFSALPYSIARYQSAAMRRRVDELVARGDVDVVVCDFLTPAVNVSPRLPVPAILFQHNVEALIWQRQAEVARNPLAKAFFRGQWRRMRRFERAQCRRFDHVVAVSPADAELHQRDYGVERVSAVATGVDVEYFAPAVTATRTPRSLLFLGSMDWFPNEDAIRFFVSEILPLIRAELPDVTLTVVGRKPGPALTALDGRDGIRITGSVPDVRPWLEQSAVFVLPLRVGGGTRLKVFEAMAMGIPVVSTIVGVEGLPVRDGEHALLADDPRSFARATLELLRDSGTGARLAARASRLVREECSWERVAHDFAATCESVTAGRRDPSFTHPS